MAFATRMVMHVPLFGRHPYIFASLSPQQHPPPPAQPISRILEVTAELTADANLSCALRNDAILAEAGNQSSSLKPSGAVVPVDVTATLTADATYTTLSDALRKDAVRAEAGTKIQRWEIVVRTYVVAVVVPLSVAKAPLTELRVGGFSAEDGETVFRFSRRILENRTVVREKEPTRCSAWVLALTLLPADSTKSAQSEPQQADAADCEAVDRKWCQRSGFKQRVRKRTGRGRQ